MTHSEKRTLKCKAFIVLFFLFYPSPEQHNDEKIDATKLKIIWIKILRK